MFGIKVLLASAAISCILVAVVLLWLEEKSTCEVYTYKLIETILIIAGVYLTVEASQVKLK